MLENQQAAQQPNEEGGAAPAQAQAQNEQGNVNSEPANQQEVLPATQEIESDEEPIRREEQREASNERKGSIAQKHVINRQQSSMTR